MFSVMDAVESVRQYWNCTNSTKYNILLNTPR